MARKKIHVGMAFGRLTTVKYLGCRNQKTPIWECKCVCGNTTEVMSHHLLGETKSCGCLRKELRQESEIECVECNRIYPIDNFYKKGPKINTRHNKCKKCASKIRTEKRKARNRRDKHNALCAYGGTPPRCACCQDTHYEFMTIDHINGGGNKHRKELGQWGGRLFRWLRDEGWPSGFRVLCINCNWAIGVFGYCPHNNLT